MKTQLLILVAIGSLLQFCRSEDKEYLEFYNRVKAEEPYIGFFAAEQKCISEITDEYLEERRKFFIGIKDCKEDIEEFTDPFIEFLITNKLLKKQLNHEYYSTAPRH